MLVTREILAPSRIWESLHSLRPLEATPLSRFGITNIRGPLRNMAINRRHGLFSFEALLTQNGYDALLDAIAGYPEATELRLTEAELAGYVLAIHLPAHSSWLYLQGLVGYKAERARRAKNLDSETFFRKRLEELKEQNRGHAELQVRTMLKSTVH